ncbi:DUF7739 domain-containing protein [Streptomyces sp. NPDC001205]
MIVILSHGMDFFGELAHSTERLADLATALGRLPVDGRERDELAAVQEVLRHDARQPLEIAPDQAGQIAAVLRRAAANRWIKPTAAAEAALLSQCAQRAADAGETWIWR